MTSAHAQLEALKKIDLLLERNPDERETINAAIFGTCNKLGIHPSDLAIYILIRTNHL